VSGMLSANLLIWLMSADYLSCDYLHNIYYWADVCGSTYLAVCRSTYLAATICSIMLSLRGVVNLANTHHKIKKVDKKK
jgi:hypothetical protein